VNLASPCPNQLLEETEDARAKLQWRAVKTQIIESSLKHG